MKVTKIEAKSLPQIAVCKKVVAYCRVSTLQEIQYHSLETQQQCYENLIQNHPGWIFAGIYSDQASGRHNAKMKAFQQLMDDCRNNNIDLILVKSISRIALLLRRQAHRADTLSSGMGGTAMACSLKKLQFFQTAIEK